MVAESGIARGSAGSVGVPATLQDSLMARLDRLPRGKPVAQIASAIGRSFGGSLVAHVGELSVDAAAQGVQQLVGADLVEPIEGVEGDRYVFRHALIQDAAYRSLLRRDRVRVHSRIAGALLDTEIAVTQPARVAHHYAESEQPKPAIELFLRAGQNALASSAAKEAVLHYESALPLIERLPEEERDSRELGLRIGLAHAIVGTSGYGNAAVAENFTLATEICDRSPGGQTPFGVASGLWGYQLVRGEPQESEAAVARIKRMADLSQKPHHVFHAHYADGAQAFYTGQFERALHSLNTANDLLGAGHKIRSAGTTDSAANCPMYLGWAEHFVGYCDRGLKRQLEGVAAAEKAGKAFPQIEAMVHLVNLRHDRLEPEGTVELCDRVIEMALEYGFNFWLGVCYSVRGWAKARCGDAEEGILEASRGLDIFRSLGSYVPHVYRASCLVEALLEAERHREALSEIDRALERAAGRYDRFWDAEIFRLRAVGQMHTGAPGDAIERDLRRAMALAETQHAWSLALRATTTWAEWLEGEGRRGEARDVLRERLAAVEASDDLPDIRAARGVLATL
jgi:tetratricopeptide (TPR) repeat protein